MAGSFYPGDPAALAAEVASYLAEVGARAAVAPPKAIIAPHAGYIYSGPIAASVYARLAPLRDVVRRVVLAGPAHRVYVAHSQGKLYFTYGGGPVFTTPPREPAKPAAKRDI